ncbi:prenyltransferase [Fructilactobacillus fructivorans]|uniref:Putative prenyltransferase, contains 1,4-dihydroxy-2-naphthoate octaprenyltransferase domain n=1 Tax=Fructilactobacillus fructivorans TaxID=1614 RepID=A0A0C1Q3B7_9LACO|nr:prenyltransferase [Fructilactobacillus fructivorans]KID42363.1 putative prenyltransferase, contains 1,4-dihydroxy-2-naphthoate octaprenyltransferase domain [Fructilactobacillus fructivorans]MCT0151020.1 prenyltransferase [Fructilactobacillus fructivorans]MCT2867422.1 prenyltransferase [Fructilactobacillus fructivorans]MCT2869059.1 prenyltransferase [Fructilactobacillus fructivorans]MCT2873221.1 prenyltransferase [Fructilactobacillus fructivorans]
MTWKYFYQLTEMYTTPVDVLLLLFCASFSYYFYGSFNWLYATWAFFIVFGMHLFLNIHNNLEDYEHATDVTDYKHSTSIIGMHHLSLKMIRNWVIGMGVIIAILGLILAYFTGWPTLVIGVIGFGLGVAYSAGPRPLDSTPFCELATGMLIMFFDPLVYVYLGSINRHPFTWGSVWDVFLGTMFLFVLAYITQLANNTCDLHQDIGNHRYTLVYYIGKSDAIKLFTIVFWLTILIIPILSYFGYVPLLSNLTILAYPLAWKKIKVFLTNQSKKEVYHDIVGGVTMLMGIYIVTYMIGTLIKFFL